MMTCDHLEQIEQVAENYIWSNNPENGPILDIAQSMCRCCVSDNLNFSLVVKVEVCMSLIITADPKRFHSVQSKFVISLILR